MPLIIPAKPDIEFVLRTTKPFHNKKAANDFFDLVLSYGPHYRPVKYGRYEPLREVYEQGKEEELRLSWFEGVELTEEQLEGTYYNISLSIKGKAPSKIQYFIGWQNWTQEALFNMISITISKAFLQKNQNNFKTFLNFCHDLIQLFPPVHAEIYDYTSAIPCTSTPNAFIPDDLSIRCPALKWRTYFGPPYIQLLGRETILKAPCWKTEEIGDTIMLQLTESVFEDIPQELRQRVVDYFENSVDPKLHEALGSGFLFRPYYATEKYSQEKKLVPKFPIEEMIGKNLDFDKVAEQLKPLVLIRRT